MICRAPDLRRTALVALLLCAFSASSVAAQEAVAAPPEKTLLIMNFQIKGDVDAGVASTINDILASAMVSTGRFRVMTGDDIQSLMALESGKQAAGCETDSCLAEIAGALGAELVITGRVGRLGSLYVAKLSLIEPATASTLGLETLEAESFESFSERLKPLAKRFTARAYGEAVEDIPAPPPPKTPGPPADDVDTASAGGGLGTLFLIGGGATVAVALGLTAVAAGVAIAGLGIVNDAQTPGAQKTVMQNLGPTMASVAVGGLALAVVGGAITVTGLLVE